jgi:hypothetical protein
MHPHIYIPVRICFHQMLTIAILMMEQKKKTKRAVTKELIAKLDSLLPATSTSQDSDICVDGILASRLKTRNRALGKSGR